jgi:drug/metabolite transporter (DMT)-like permease
MTIYLYIGLTILFTVIGQLLVKAGMSGIGSFPKSKDMIINYLWKAVTNWKVFLGLIMAVFAALTWMAVVSQSAISFAYPFMSLAIVLVLALSGLFFDEIVPLTRWIGVLIVCIGLIVATR